MENNLSPLFWIIGSSILMCALALIGVTTLSLKEAALKRLLLPLVALSAGSLLGGAFFHMIPEAVEKTGAELSVYIYVAAGNFIYIGASDLIPEVNKHCGLARNILHFTCFSIGLLILLGLRIVFHD